MITQPAKAASMKTYMATKPLIEIAKSMAVSCFGSGYFCGWFGRRCLVADARIGVRLGRLVLHLTVVREHGLGKNLVAPVDCDDVVLHHQSQQVVLVLRIELARVFAEKRRNIQRRDDSHLAYLRRFAGPRFLAVAAALSGEVDDHGACLHPRD